VYVAPVGRFPQTAECYFDRAIRWRPNDPNVYLVQGIYLQLKGDLDAALKAYKKSESLQPNSADLQYNLGLLYFERKQYNLAKVHAKRAYQLGYPLPGLRHKLTVVGHWP
jgi:tetratricopeptide (TPR) repeat protein